MHTHSDRLERWLGAEQVARVSDAMRGWYGPPIAVHGVPGAVFATRDGDFVGEIRAGQEVGAFDVAQAALLRFNRAQRAKVAQHKVWHRQGRGLAAGNRQAHAFSSLSALISAATGGKKQDLTFQKAGVASNAAGNCIDLWAQGSQPAAGAAGGAARPGQPTPAPPPARCRLPIPATPTRCISSPATSPPTWRPTPCCCTTACSPWPRPSTARPRKR